MKKINSFILFILTILVIDIILSLAFDKEINLLIENRLNIVEEKKTDKHIWGATFFNIDDIAMWSQNYRWPTFNYEANKKLDCRVLWLWDSIIYWSWVWWESTYFNLLNNKLKNTEFINLWIPWFDLLQSITKLKEDDLYLDTDLLILHIWSDDNHVYKLIDWVLFDANIVLNNIWEPFLFNWIPEFINNFLLKKSYFYNKILKIKMKWEIQYNNLDLNEYLVWELKITLEKFILSWEDKKVLILLSPSLENNSYKWKNWWDNEWYPYFYRKIENELSLIDNINILYLDSFFKWTNVEGIRNDTCCHFNEEWHNIISEKLNNYIKTNWLLDEKCF